MADYSIPTDKEIADKVRELITAYRGRHYSVPELAASCWVTPFALKRIFKKIHGESIAAFSLRSRMNRAKELLETTNNTLQMIAEEVGYTEGNNFQAIFKRVVGCTPGEYRRSLKPGNAGHFSEKSAGLTD